MENNNNLVRVQASFVGKVNFAGHQNAVPCELKTPRVNPWRI